MINPYNILRLTLKDKKTGELLPSLAPLKNPHLIDPSTGRPFPRLRFGNSLFEDIFIDALSEEKGELRK